MAKIYLYNGEQHTLTSLQKLSSVSRRTLSDRLANGWDVEKAVNTPRQNEAHKTCPPEMYANGNIDIIFEKHIPGVFMEMQPVLDKVYSAEPHRTFSSSKKSKLYYIIKLEDGKPLIVYPEEFQWVKPAADAA